VRYAWRRGRSSRQPRQVVRDCHDVVALEPAYIAGATLCIDGGQYLQ